MQNFGDFTFTNAESIANTDSRKYLMYNEGIYVGYRYYETRYEDSVLKQGNAASSAGVFASKNSTWNYAEEVQFPLKTNRVPRAKTSFRYTHRPPIKRAA